MTPATQIFEKKGVYHGELVRVTDPDGLQITLKGKPRESQDGNSHYVYFQVPGADFDNYYTIENDAIKDYLEACPINTPVTIHAFGSREAATISVDGEDGAAVIDGQPMGNRPQDGPPTLYPEDDETPGAKPAAHQPDAVSNSATGSSHGDLYLQCLLSARASHAAFTKQTGTPVSDDDIRIATTMFINASR